MEKLLFFSGLWVLLVAFAKWSIITNAFYRVVCVVVGVYSISIGLCSFFFAIERETLYVLYISMLFINGMLVGLKYATEKTILSFASIAVSIILVALSIMIIVNAKDTSDISSSCIALVGTMQILSVFYTPLHDRVKNAKKLRCQ